MWGGDLISNNVIEPNPWIKEENELKKFQNRFKSAIRKLKTSKEDRSNVGDVGD